MRKSSVTKIDKLFAEVRSSILERIQSHLLHCTRVKNVYDGVETILRMSQEPLFPCSSKDGSLSGDLHRNMLSVEPAIAILTTDHAGIVEAVIAFNKLVLMGGEERKKYFIKFDKDTALVFDDVREKLMSDTVLVSTSKYRDKMRHYASRA